MKLLFLSLPLHGHVNPTLPLVRELAARGHEVVYFGGDRFATAVADAGARYQSYGGGHFADADQMFVQTEAIAARLMNASARVLAADLDRFRAERVDCIVTDSVAPWGQWAGRILRLPVVTSVSTFAFNRHVLKFSAAHGVRPKSFRMSLLKLRHLSEAFVLGQRLRRTYGVTGPGPLRSVLGRSGLNIVYTSRYLQPCAETFDESFHFVGPSVGARIAGAAGKPDGVGGDPSIYVSLGTVFNADAGFYRKCFEAFSGSPLRVVMSTGRSVSPASLGPAPPNFIVRSQVPQLEVLQQASAFVSHGGMNSVSESLHFGVPVVVVPQTGEQALVGRRVEQLGAGLYLAKDEAGTEPLRAAVRQLLDDGRFRQAAGAVRKSFDEAGGAPRAADAIDSYVSRSSGIGT